MPSAQLSWFLACSRKYKRTGDLRALDNAVTLLRQVLETIPTGQPNRAMYLSHLSQALRLMFERTRDFGVLIEAVDIGRRALEAVPPEHANRASYLNILSGDLKQLFEQTGDLQVLREAVTVGRQAVEAVTIDPPQARHVPIQSLRRLTAPIRANRRADGSYGSSGCGAASTGIDHHR